MKYTVAEVQQFVSEMDVKFVKLAFCDLFGSLKNISILAEELPRAFREGIAFDASAVAGFLQVERSDLYLKPDPSTLTVLPWRPQQGRVARMYCDIFYPDGKPFEADGRYILRQAVERAKQEGYTVMVGPECEFYLFEMDDRGRPTRVPHDEAGYLDVAPMDRGENVRREICLTLEEMDIHPESSLHEQGPGQNEIDFRYSPALEAADNLSTFKTVVRTVAARNGLSACFLPKPMAGESGSGLHINMSLFKDGLNIFKNDPFQHCPQAESFIAGVLHYTREATAFFNPIPGSYRRLGEMEAPIYQTWSHENRSQLIRIPAAKGESARMELRSPDPMANPYLVFALLLEAGMEGIRQDMQLPPATDENLYLVKDAQRFTALPRTLEQALALIPDSRLVARCLPEKTVKTFMEHKAREWAEDCAADDPFAYEMTRYRQ
jgi:glutamine synthetase